MIGQGFDFLHVIDFIEDTSEETYPISNSLWFGFFSWVGISYRNLLFSTRVLKLELKCSWGLILFRVLISYIYSIDRLRKTSGMSEAVSQPFVFD